MLEDSFIANFVLGGFIIAFVKQVTTTVNDDWGGFVYGAIPITYIYLYIAVAGKTSESKKSFAKSTLYSVLSWIVFVLVTYLFANLGTTYSLLLALFVFILSLWVQYKYAYKFGITL